MVATISNHSDFLPSHSITPSLQWLSQDQECCPHKTNALQTNSIRTNDICTNWHHLHLLPLPKHSISTSQQHLHQLQGAGPDILRHHCCNISHRTNTLTKPILFLSSKHLPTKSTNDSKNGPFCSSLNCSNNSFGFKSFNLSKSSSERSSMTFCCLAQVNWSIFIIALHFHDNRRKVSYCMTTETAAAWKC